MRVSQQSATHTDSLDAARVLHERSASIHAVVEGKLNRFSACLQKLEEVAEALGAPVAVVGGLAAIHHRAQVTTLDIDISVGKEQLSAIVREVTRHGLTVRRESPNGWHRFVFPHREGDVEVHVIPEGAKSPRDPAHAPPNPGPRDLGVSRGLGYAAFAPWVVMKLVTGRDRDRYQLVEALKNRDEGEKNDVGQKLRPLDPSYLREFERLLRAAEEEREQENW